MTTLALRAPSQPFPFRVAFLLVLALGTVTSVASAPLAHAATVRTDYLDYSPGDEVLVTGTGWLPNETVSLYFDETPYQFVPITLYTVADADGNISNHDYMIQDYHLGTAFVLTATGLTSGITAQTLFTDSPKVGSVSVSDASGAPCAGTSAPTTFTVTVFRGNGGGSAGAFTADLTVPSGLPSGTSASFSPNPVSFTPGAASRIATLTLTTSAGTPSGTSTFRVKAATSASDTASTTATFTVNQPPSITSPGNLTASNAPGQCGATVTFAATATGSPAPTITYSKNPGTVFPVGVTTITATATNACGSVSTTFTITVNDTERPSIATSNLTRSTDPGVCGATVALGTTASDNCSVASLTGVRSDAAALGAVFPVGTTTVTWTALDLAGNSTTATQTVTVNDTEKPALAAPANLTITTGSDATQCGANADDTALGTPTASDNCSVSVTRDGVPAGHFFPVGTHTITYAAMDPSGNTTTATQQVTVLDTTPPSLTSADITRSNDAGTCGALIGDLGTSASDLCGDVTLTGTRSDGAPLTSAFPVGTTTISWTATDLAGNATHATQTVTVEDHENPTIQTASITRNTDHGVCGATIADLGTTAEDNCEGVTFTGVRSDGAPLSSAFPVGATTITWTATDAAGNSATASQTITIEDHEKPVLSAPGDLTVTTGADATQCGATAGDTALGAPTASDNCSVSVTRDGVPAGNFFPVGTHTITYTATDPSGNTTTTTQQVTVLDTTAPSLTTTDITRSNDNGTCGALIGDLGTSAADLCSAVNLSGTRSDGAPLNASFPVGATRISWTATDTAGNATHATQTVTIEDHENPTIQTAAMTLANDPGACGATIATLGTTAQDNCEGVTLTGIRSDGAPLSSTFPVGTTTITWTATDAAGNTTNAAQTVTVSDTEKPALAAPGDLTITTGADATQCGANANDAALGTPTATDNCSASVTRDGVPTGNFFPVGTTTITYTATDPSGNMTTATQHVTVLDTTPPAITTAALDVPTGEGLCNATIESLGTTAADNCGGTTLTGTRSDGAPLGDPFPVGITTITWQAVDVAGNASSLTQTVKVSDVEIPTLALPAVVEQFTGAGASSCAALVSEAALGTPIASDNCGVTVTRTGVPAGNLFPIGTTTITYTATDPSGNSTTATQTVKVTDNTPPTLSAPADVTLGTGPGATGCGLTVANATLGTASASDNCSATVQRTGVPAGNLFPIGTTTVTYTATDPSGNTTTVTQKVTILDTTPPSITTSNLSVSTSAGVCSATLASLGTTAADNCGAITPTGSRSDGAAIGAAFPTGTTTITWTATDAAGNTTTATQTITVTNATPQVTILNPVSGTICAAGTNLSVSGLFADNAGDLHTARWICDALTIPATVNEATGAVGGTLCFTTPGVYKVTLQVTDQCSNTGSASQVGGLEAMIVVYDPSGGFVTGGGWIQSPAGSYAANPALVGKANFGFVSKYKKGQSTPTGETEFQFKSGDLNFHSASYEWLVVAGAKAQFKGTGTINGNGNFGFMITATDGHSSGGGGTDKFRIKITDKATSLTVYDNQMGASDDAIPSTALGGGTIAIHSSSGVLSAALMGPGSLEAEGVAPAATALFQNSPNPFNPVTTIRFALREAGRVTIQVYGIHGELVRTVVDASLPAGTHTATWNGTTRSGGRAASGVYYAVLQTGGFRDKVQMVMVK